VHNILRYSTDMYVLPINIVFNQTNVLDTQGHW